MKKIIRLSDNERSRRYLANMGVKPCDDVNVIEVDSPVQVKQDSLLDIIYGLDPETNLPSGDFVMYLGKDTSPEIRQYIQSQLLSEYPRGTGVPVEQEDVLFDYLRQTNEPVNDYVRRITDFEKQRVSELHNK